MFNRVWELFKNGIAEILTARFKDFRLGAFAGIGISSHFLFSIQGVPFRDLIWVFPLKLFSACVFAFLTGLATHIAGVVYKHKVKNIAEKIFKQKNNDQEKDDDKAA
jgi:hypothetical protein